MTSQIQHRELSDLTAIALLAAILRQKSKTLQRIPADPETCYTLATHLRSRLQLFSVSHATISLVSSFHVEAFSASTELLTLSSELPPGRCADH